MDLYACSQVEMLYQRYFLRMNQTNMTHLLGLLLTVAVGLMVVQVRTLLIAQEWLGRHAINNTYFDTFKYVDLLLYYSISVCYT